MGPCAAEDGCPSEDVLILVNKDVAWLHGGGLCFACHAYFIAALMERQSTQYRVQASFDFCGTDIQGLDDRKARTANKDGKYPVSAMFGLIAAIAHGSCLIESLPERANANDENHIRLGSEEGFRKSAQTRRRI